MSLKRATEAFVSSALFELGTGSVILSRFKSDCRVESGVFLLDVYCLGVKDATFVRLDTAEYENELLKPYSARDALEPIEPPCARKLVEDAVRYAAGLGFQTSSGLQERLPRVWRNRCGCMHPPIRVWVSGQTALHPKSTRLAPTGRPDYEHPESPLR